MKCLFSGSRSTSRNGASLIRARKLPSNRTAYIWSVSFNGASLIRARKQVNRAHGVIRPILASMGPHSFERGNKAPGKTRPRRHESFNGASLIRARKLSIVLRRDITMAASMGPHSFERGNLSCNSVPICRIPCFNGASLIRARKRALAWRAR